MFGRGINSSGNPNNLEIVSQHDGAKLGFQIVREDDPNHDGFLDPELISGVFLEIYKAIDADGNRRLSVEELVAAKDNPVLKEVWSKLIAYHPTEWRNHNGTARRLSEMLTGPDIPPEDQEYCRNLLPQELVRMQMLSFWDRLNPRLPEESYYFHPVVFICNLLRFTDLNNVIRKIGDIISHGEGNYESYNTGTKGVPNGRVGFSFLRPSAGTVTGKTINEIIATDSLSGTDRNRMFATGKYQTIISTLITAKDKMNLTGNEKYDPEMQERVFREYLFEKAGGGALARFVNDKKWSIDDALYAASKEWASIAAPAGRSIKNGSISDGTKSYYESSANTANNTSTWMLRAILEEIGKN